MKRAAGLLAFIVIILLIVRMQAPGGRMQVPGCRLQERERIEDKGRRIEEKGAGRKVGAGPADLEARGGLNREASSLIYSKHARCRMECRHISENEVREILRSGQINYSKSDMRGQPDPKYALEGLTKDGQEVRIIFANSPRGIVVVTVIDLENEWKCNCK